jgi:histidinol-phosphatase
MHAYFLEIGRAAVEAAKQITLRAWGRSDEELETTIKQDDSRFTNDRQKSPVTKIDSAAEQQIKSIISAAFPEHGFIGEEEGEERSDAPYKRIIDPIDGTRNYVRGLPYWAILLALSHHDEIIVSIVCIPMIGDLIWATK